MASKVTRTCLIAVSAIGASGLVAVSAAEAAPPTIPTTYVNQPSVAGVTKVTPESATLNGVIDTGGTNPMSTFTIPTGATLNWDNSFILPAGTYRVDGLPSDGSQTQSYPTGTANVVIPNSGENNYSTVLFEYDPLSDYTANGNNPGPETGFADEVNVPTNPGLSQVSATIGAYPAASDASLSSPLTPGTKYVYFLVQQAGATDSGLTINTYNGSATGVNPTYSCFPLAYIATTSPYSGYTSTGTISGGVVATGGAAQTTPQPQIQGPCVYYYGGGANYYNSNIGTFTTPALGVTKFAYGKVVGQTAQVTVQNQSVEASKGSIELDYKGKTVGNAKFSVSAHATKVTTINLTSYGKKLISPASISRNVKVVHYVTVKGHRVKKVSTKKLTVSVQAKPFTAQLNYTSDTDQPTTTKSVTL